MDSIDYYNKYAASVFEETVNQDMGELTTRFLEYLEEGATILDMGCGSGRDSLVFYEAGYDVTPLDASLEMCKLAQIHTGLEVLNMTYEEMKFYEVFDGIWACASLVHIPGNQLSQVIDRIADGLKHHGICYFSMKQGDFEGFRGERYYCEYTPDTIRNEIEKNQRLQIIDIWETSDSRGDHKMKKWINILTKKIK